MKETRLMQKLTELLRDLDGSPAPMDEQEISSNIKALMNTITCAEIPFEFRAEHIAFSLCESNTCKGIGWDTYFGPSAVFCNDDGSTSGSIRVKLIDAATIDYWTQRAKACESPLLKARYYGLIWDLSIQATGIAPSHTVGREYVENLLLVAENDLHKSAISTVTKLERALSVSMGLNCQDLTNQCKCAIIQYEDRVAVDKKAGLWGFSFDLLLGNKNLAVSEAEELTIIDNLESRLNRLSKLTDDVAPDPWSCEHAALRLAKYYRARNRTDDVRRVLKKLESASLCIAEQAAPLMAQGLIDKMHSTYSGFGLSEEAEFMAIKLRELGPGINDDMKEVSHKIEIDREEFDKHIEAMTEGKLDEAIVRIAECYIPLMDEVKARLKDIANHAVFLYRVRRKITDHKGRTLAVLGSLEDDPDGHLALQMAQEMNFSSFFLDAVMVRLIDRHKLDAETLMSHIACSPIFREEKKSIIIVGLRAYIQCDYVTAAHLIVPQIEDAIRELVETQHVAVLKKGRNGGFVMKTLDEMLRNNKVKLSLGDDMAFYLRVLLTDQRGWNLRNNICHGLLPAEAFCKSMNDRLVHALLCLSLLRAQSPEV